MSSCSFLLLILINFIVVKYVSCMTWTPEPVTLILYTVGFLLCFIGWTWWRSWMLASVLAGQLNSQLFCLCYCISDSQVKHLALSLDKMRNVFLHHCTSYTPCFDIAVLCTCGAVRVLMYINFFNDQSSNNSNGSLTKSWLYSMSWSPTFSYPFTKHRCLILAQF